MSETETPPRRRARRSTEASRRLEQARERNARQLADQREREGRVDQALKDFMTAWQKIVDTESACEEKVAEVELQARRRIERLREQAAAKLRRAHATQANAAREIFTANRTVDQVADLLGVSQRKARQLIADARSLTDKHVDSPSPSPSPAPETPQPPQDAAPPTSTERDPDGEGPAPQQDTDGGFVSAVAYRGGDNI